MKKLCTLFLFLLAPALAFADGGVEAAALFGAIILTLLIVGVVGLAFAIVYMKTGKSWAFIVSAIFNSLVFGAGVLIYIPTQDSGFAIGELTMLGSMLIFVALAIKRSQKRAHKANSKNLP